MGRRIAAGLILGVACGLFFGEYCNALTAVGLAYVGLLQMTVLPYLILSLVAKIGRLDWQQVRQLGGTALGVLLIFWAVGVILMVLVSYVLPPLPGSSFYSAAKDVPGGSPAILTTFIPANVFRALSEEYVPAIVVFCVFFGGALGSMPGKQPLLDYLELCAGVVGRINHSLIQLAPIGLFALTASAAGSLRMDELARLQAYLIIFGLACGTAAFIILPVLLSSVTDISYREIMSAARGPMLIAVATGKLFVVLPEISQQCEDLLRKDKGPDAELGASTVNALVPLAYPFPHLGKIFTFTFISFAAWYVGRGLTAAQTTAMATAGTASSFASPLVAIPAMLDQYQLPQDLMAFFLLPGFLTTRMADVVGVMHLMVLTLLVTRALQGRIQVQWRRLAVSGLILLIGLGLTCVAGRWYLVATTIKQDLDQRLMSLEIPSPYQNSVVYENRSDAPAVDPPEGSTLERVRTSRVLRVGYHGDQFPYSFVNRFGHLAGMDVELMHRLAERLQVRLEFVPFTPEKLVEQLEAGEIDVAIGGLVVLPERLLNVGFTESYDTATIAVVTRDHCREKYATWDNVAAGGGRLGVLSEDTAAAARRALPDVVIVPIPSVRSYFASQRSDIDGLIMSAEAGAAWTVLHPEFAATVPKPSIRRPVGLAVRNHDALWLQFLDRCLEFERLDGVLERLRIYWVEGGGAQKRAPRWSVLRDVLHWVPD